MSWQYNNRSHNWWLTSKKRNKLMKTINGNIITTQWPHENRPPNQKQHHANLLLYNSRRAYPTARVIDNYLNPHHAPNLIIQTETHQTPTTKRLAQTKWKTLGFTSAFTNKRPGTNSATGISAHTPIENLGISLKHSDTNGRILEIDWHLAPQLTITVIACYAPQKTEPPETLMSYAKQIVERIRLAHIRQRPIILLGDFQAVMSPQLDQEPMAPGIAPLWLRTIYNNPYVPLQDPWRRANPTQVEYTYYHQDGKYADRKDQIWMSPELVPTVIWFTNALWPVTQDHTCVSCTIDISKLEHTVHFKPERDLPAPLIEPHTSEKWNKYRKFIVTNQMAPDRWMATDTQELTNHFLTIMQNSAETADIYTHRRNPPKGHTPYCHKKMRPWQNAVHWCHKMLSTNWRNLPHQHKHTAWQTIARYNPKYVHPQTWIPGPLPPNVITDIKNTRREIQTRINTHLEKTSNKTWEKYKERINKLAMEDPSRFYATYGKEQKDQRTQRTRHKA
jgi:exonuclease III